MEKRALLAVILSILVIIIYQYLFVPKKPPLPPEKTVKEKIEESPLFSEENEIIETFSTREDSELHALFQEQKKRKEKNITLETRRFKAVINTKNARIISWKLKKYHLSKNYETAPWKKDFWLDVASSYRSYFNELFNKTQPIANNDHIDLFNSLKTENSFGLSLVVEIGQNKNSDSFTGLYEFSEKEDYFSLNSENSEKVLKFTYLTSRGIQVEKIFTFYNDSYQFDVQIIGKNIAPEKNIFDYGITLGPGLGNSFQSGTHRFEGPVTWVNGKRKKNKPKKKTPAIAHSGNILWSAMTSNYFLTSIMPKRDTSEVIIQRPKLNNLTDINKATIIGIHYPKRTLNPGESITDDYRCYFGPKIYQELKAIGLHLENAIDYGFFSFLAKPLIWLLNKFYTLIPNYGIAIILLTIIIKIIFWPLTDKSFRSMKNMQDLQPKMSALREKYKSDPKKLNEEMLKMYKQRGVNPMGGCLPLLLQIPVFFALYEGLMVAIEIRGAHFMFWIKDLSVMDPLLITPLLMGVTMYYQQKMTPMTGDAAQVKMMTMLPVIFTVFFLGFPSGLVIYWLLNNVLTIGQHYGILKKHKAVT